MHTMQQKKSFHKEDKRVKGKPMKNLQSEKNRKRCFHKLTKITIVGLKFSKKNQWSGHKSYYW